MPGSGAQDVDNLATAVRLDELIRHPARAAGTLRRT
jgi:hypothetical protein